MRTFWWLGLWLFVVLLMLCTGALIAGRALPPAEAVPELRQCDGMPCLLGIVPGKTGWEEAKKVVPNLSVKEMTLGITYSERAYGLTQMGTDVVVTMDDKATINELSLWEPGTPNTNLAHIVVQFGDPCEFSASRTSRALTLFLQYPDVEFVFVTGGADNPRPWIPLSYTVLQRHPCEPDRPWKGFQTLRWY